MPRPIPDSQDSDDDDLAGLGRGLALGPVRPRDCRRCCLVAVGGRKGTSWASCHVVQPCIRGHVSGPPAAIWAGARRKLNPDACQSGAVGEQGDYRSTLAEARAGREACPVLSRPALLVTHVGTDLQPTWGGLSKI